MARKKVFVDTSFVAFLLYKKYEDKDWGLVDCLSFVIMEEKNINEVLTFDRHFLQAGLKVLTIK